LDYVDRLKIIDEIIDTIGEHDRRLHKITSKLAIYDIEETFTSTGIPQLEKLKALTVRTRAEEGF
jgi:hypothetical protein